MGQLTIFFSEIKSAYIVIISVSQKPLMNVSEMQIMYILVFQIIVNLLFGQSNSMHGLWM